MICLESTHQSCSGDVHFDIVATFDDNKRHLAEQLWREMMNLFGKEFDFTLRDDYTPIPHNPTCYMEIYNATMGR